MAGGKGGPEVEDHRVQSVFVTPVGAHVWFAALAAEAVEGEGGGDEVGELAHVGFGSYCGEPLKLEDEDGGKHFVGDRPLSLVQPPALAAPVLVVAPKDLRAEDLTSEQ